MNPIGTKLTAHYSQLSVSLSPGARPGQDFTFPQYRDFSPGLTSNGECPHLFSFYKNFPGQNSWVELMDGLCFLIPFLHSDIFLQNQDKVILPKEALKYIPRTVKSFYYAIPEFAEELDKDSSKKSECYIYLDYYEAITLTKNWQDRIKRVEELSNHHEKVYLILNSMLLGSYQDRELAGFYESLRSLPRKCEFLSLGNFISIKNIERVKVYFLYDEEIVLKSPLENYVLVRNGIPVKGEKIDPQDTLVKSFNLAPNVKKQVYKHTIREWFNSEKTEQELVAFLKTIKSSEELPDKNFRRVLFNIVNYQGRKNED